MKILKKQKQIEKIPRTFENKFFFLILLKMDNDEKIFYGYLKFHFLTLKSITAVNVQIRFVFWNYQFYI